MINKLLSFLMILAISIFYFTQITYAQTDFIPTEILKSETTDIIADIPLDTNTILYAYKTTIVANEQNEILEKRKPNAKIFYNENGTYTARIYSGNTFYQDMGDSLWYTVDYATTTKDVFDYWTIDVENLLSQNNSWWWINSAYAQTTLYPEAGDGWVRYETTTNWQTAHDATTGTGASYVAGTGYIINGKTGSEWKLYRGFFPFDTSGLDPYCVASSSLHFKTTATAPVSLGVNIVNSTQGATDTLTTSDYDNLDLQELSTRQNIGSANTWYSFVLNDNDVIDTQGNTLLALRGDWDLDDIDPTGYYEYFEMSFLEDTGSANDPFLMVDLETCGEPEPTATTTLTDLGDLQASDDLTIITGYITHYTDSTSTPSEIEVIRYHIPFFGWLVIAIVFIPIVSRLLLEFIIRYRQDL